MVEGASVAGERLRVRHRGRTWRIGRWVVLAVWMAVAAVIVAAQYVWVSPEVLYLWLPIVALGAPSLLLALRSGASLPGVQRRGGPGDITFEGDAITVSTSRREHRFARSDIAWGFTDAEGAVLVTRDGTEIAIALREPARAAEVLRLAGVAPDQRAAKLVVHPREPWVARLFGFFFVMFVTPMFLAALFLVARTAYAAAMQGGEWGLVLFCVFLASIPGLMLRVLVKRLPTTTLWIGTDGVRVERLWRKRLIRRAGLVGATVDGDELVLKLRRGKPLRISATHEGAVAVAARIREALLSPVTGDASDASIERLDRGGRSVPMWLSELRSLGRAAVDYRRAALGVDALLELVKDGAAPAERRIAAAVVLSEQKSEAARTALRVAAETCVDAEVRAVIEQAAEGEIEAAAVEELVRREHRR